MAKVLKSSHPTGHYTDSKTNRYNGENGSLVSTEDQPPKPSMWDTVKQKASDVGSAVMDTAVNLGKSDAAKSAEMQWAAESKAAEAEKSRAAEAAKLKAIDDYQKKRNAAGQE